VCEGGLRLFVVKRSQKKTTDARGGKREKLLLEGTNEELLETKMAKASLWDLTDQKKRND